eukprot:GHVL01045056.1.p1 GENE.GHVL01045056.1~~GHVL01045056.1.p1  ORF type:complete len:177 (+),score=3.94 GHVL01045056.1:210-740(+)
MQASTAARLVSPWLLRCSLGQHLVGNLGYAAGDVRLMGSLMGTLRCFYLKTHTHTFLSRGSKDMLLAAFLRCSVRQRHHHQQQQQPTKLAYSGSPLYAYFDIQSLRKLAVCDINVDAYLNLVPVGISFLTVHSLPYIFFFLHAAATVRGRSARPVVGPWDSHYCLLASKRLWQQIV